MFFAQTSNLDTLEILRRVDDFYFHAWVMLLGLVTLLTAVLGWLVPRWLERGRQETFRRSEERVLKELKDEIENQTLLFMRNIESVRGQMNSNLQRSASYALFSLATAERLARNPDAAMRGFAGALIHGLAGGNDEEIGTIFKSLFDLADEYPSFLFGRESANLKTVTEELAKKPQYREEALRLRTILSRDKPRKPE